MSEIATRIRSTADQDGAAILDIESNRIITLNTTGGFIWTRLKQGESVEVIVQALAQATHTDPKVVEVDVHAFLGQLTEKSLLDK